MREMQLFRGAGERAEFFKEGGCSRSGSWLSGALECPEQKKARFQDLDLFPKTGKDSFTSREVLLDLILSIYCFLLKPK